MTTNEAVRGRKAIKAEIEPVLGFYPSDDQIKRWAKRPSDPLPILYVLGKPQGSASEIRAWAVRQAVRCE